VAIMRYLKKGFVFTPKALFAMGQAMKATAETLEIGSNETERRSVAKFLIRLAQEDDSLDAIALRDRAVAALGGVAYCDISARASALPDF
jgi:hypothetical protein